MTIGVKFVPRQDIDMTNPTPRGSHLGLGGQASFMAKSDKMSLSKNVSMGAGLQSQVNNRAPFSECKRTLICSAGSSDRCSQPNPTQYSHRLSLAPDLPRDFYTAAI